MINSAEREWRRLLPKDVLGRAYEASNGELAWAREDAAAVVKILQANGLTIHGVDVWLPTKPGPTIPTPFVYDWSAAYTVPALKFIETFDWDPADRSHGGRSPWFNILADKAME